MEKSSFVRKEEKAEIFEIFTRALQIGIDFKCKTEFRKCSGTSSDLKDNDHQFSELMSKIFSKSMPSTGTDIFDLLSFVTENIVEPSTNFGSPYAMAFPDAGNSVAGICGDILTAFLNQNLINWTPCSPSATVVEITVISWLRDLLGYTVASNISAPIDVGGLITSGGVLSNTIALLLARESAMPDCMRVGFNSKKGATPSIIVPDGIDHYSSRISAGWLGLGEANVFKAPSKNFKYDLDVLPQIVANLKSSSHKPILLVCYAGDSRSMSTDNFKEIRRICDTYGMWMHVDGCQGTQLIFSNKNRSKIHGIHLADSVTLDPHKVLAVPYAISVFLVKNPKHLETIKRPEDIITGEKHSFGQITPFQGSRSFASLKLFMMMKHLGREGIGRMIDRRCCFAKFVAEMVNDSKDLVLVNPSVDINSVIFMYCPEDLRMLLRNSKHEPSFLNLVNEGNMEIQRRLFFSGQVWLHSFSIPDLCEIFGDSKLILRPLRFMSGNPILDEHHVKTMINKVEEFGRKIFSQKLTVNNNYVEDKVLIDTSFVHIASPSFRNNLNCENTFQFLPLEEFCQRKSRIIQYVRSYMAKTLGVRESSKYFVIIYGSYAYSLVREGSDVDIFVAVEDSIYSTQLNDEIVSFIDELHTHHGLTKEDEVPPEVKSLLKFSFLEEACSGVGIRNGNGEWKFPDIVKCNTLLSSKSFLLRFFLGVLANSGIFVCGNHAKYLEFRTTAIQTLIRAVSSVFERKKVSSISLAKDFCTNLNGEFGDLFLGFAYKQPFISYLEELLEENLSKMDLDVEYCDSEGLVYSMSCQSKIP